MVIYSDMMLSAKVFLMMWQISVVCVSHRSVFKCVICHCTNWQKLCCWHSNITYLAMHCIMAQNPLLWADSSCLCLQGCRSATHETNKSFKPPQTNTPWPNILCYFATGWNRARMGGLFSGGYLSRAFVRSQAACNMEYVRVFDWLQWYRTFQFSWNCSFDNSAYFMAIAGATVSQSPFITIMWQILMHRCRRNHVCRGNLRWKCIQYYKLFHVELHR